MLLLPLQTQQALHQVIAVGIRRMQSQQGHHCLQRLGLLPQCGFQLVKTVCQLLHRAAQRSKAVLLQHGLQQHDVLAHLSEDGQGWNACHHGRCSRNDRYGSGMAQAGYKAVNA